MGRSESTGAFIGIKIKLLTLVNQLTTENRKLIVDMMYNGFIEDDNDDLTNRFENIIYKYDLMKKDLDERIAYLLKSIQSNKLFDAFLLLPIKKILETSRYGHGREGINGESRALDFDLTVDLTDYKDIQSIEKVFIIKQSAF